MNKIITLSSILILVFNSCSSQTTLNTKKRKGITTFITPYDTLQIEKRKVYTDYYDSSMNEFGKYWVYLDLGMTQNALNINDSLIMKYPYYHLPYNRHGCVLLNNLNDYKGAIKWFEIASALKPDEALYYYNLGLCYFHLNEGGKAIESFTKCITINSSDTAAYYMRAYSKELTGDLKGAIMDYEKDIKITPNKDASYNNLAFVYNRMGEYEKAIEACNKALDINPKKANAFHNRGISKMKLGDLKGACEDWTKAKELGGNVDGLINKYCN